MARHILLAAPIPESLAIVIPADPPVEGTMKFEDSEAPAEAYVRVPFERLGVLVPIVKRKLIVRIRCVVHGDVPVQCDNREISSPLGNFPDLMNELLVNF